MKLNWKLKDILMIAVCAVLFGFVFLGATYAGGFLSGILTPLGLSSLGYEPFYGIYFLGGAFGIYVMRKPGTGLIAEMLAAIVETLLGNFFGPIIILSGLVQGLGFELVFALKKYRRFDLATLLQASVVCSVVTLIYNLIVSGYSSIATPVLALMLAVRLVSACLIDGVLVKLLGDRLAKAGVLKGYAIGENLNESFEEE